MLLIKQIWNISPKQITHDWQAHLERSQQCVFEVFDWRDSNKVLIHIRSDTSEESPPLCVGSTKI